MKTLLLLVMLTNAAIATPKRDVLSGGVLVASQMKFELQSNGEPWPTSDCEHAKDPNENPFDWVVQCKGEAGNTKFRVHVALTRYPATNSGKNSYELLYWVTDLGGAAPTQHSVTQWIHHRDGTDPVTEYRTGLGVRDDMASLTLVVKLTK